MANDLATADIDRGAIAALELAVMNGDLAKLNAQQRMEYVASVCRSLGINPLTRPFDFIQLNGKLTLYAKKDCTEQLRRIHGVSIERIERERIDDLYVVTAYAVDAKGRKDASTGAVPIANLKGDAAANAVMKAETKAKRRVTLSICGLGLLDESELETTNARLAEPPQEPRATTEVRQPTQPIPTTMREAVVQARDNGGPVTHGDVGGEEEELSSLRNLMVLLEPEARWRDSTIGEMRGVVATKAKAWNCDALTARGRCIDKAREAVKAKAEQRKEAAAAI